MSKQASKETDLSEQADPGQVPTIGRIVLYKPTSTDAIHFRNWKGSEALPAVVVKVNAENNVNLRVFDDGPLVAWRQSVSQGDEPGQWNWPTRL